MIICVTCRVEMTVIDIHSGAHFGNGHTYAANKLECPECGARVLNCVGVSPYRDKVLAGGGKREGYIEMRSE